MYVDNVYIYNIYIYRLAFRTLDFEVAQERSFRRFGRSLFRQFVDGRVVNVVFCFFEIYSSTRSVIGTKYDCVFFARHVTNMFFRFNPYPLTMETNSLL